MGDPDHGLFVAQAADGAVIGWVHVHARRLLVADPFADLGGLVVDAGHQGQGAGRALMAQAEAWALGKGYPTLWVRSNVTRAGAHRFYERIGYRLVKSQQVFQKRLGPANEPSLA